jgi:hydroxyethylthiazole kinase-like sugar kinase family protein
MLLLLWVATARTAASTDNGIFMLTQHGASGCECGVVCGFQYSETDRHTHAVPFNAAASRQAQQWGERDKQLLHYTVEQERLRFAN